MFLWKSFLGNINCQSCSGTSIEQILYWLLVRMREGNISNRTLSDSHLIHMCCMYVNYIYFFLKYTFIVSFGSATCIFLFDGRSLWNSKNQPRIHKSSPEPLNQYFNFWDQGRINRKRTGPQCPLLNTWWSVRDTTGPQCPLLLNTWWSRWPGINQFLSAPC